MTEVYDSDRIQEIVNRYKTIQALLLVDSQGVIKLCLGCQNYDQETISAVLTTTISVFQNHLEKLKAPSWKQICIQGKEISVFLQHLAEEQVLVLLIHSDREIKSFLEEIQQGMKLIMA